MEIFAQAAYMMMSQVKKPQLSFLALSLASSQAYLVSHFRRSTPHS